MTKIKIFVTQYENNDVDDNSLVKSIASDRLFETPDEILLRNNANDNIGDRGDTFLDLVTIYWAWKNSEQDYYGFCHYNRFISFGKVKDADVYSNVCFERFDKHSIKILGYGEEKISEEIAKYDIILTEPWDVSKVGLRNLYDQYVSNGNTYRKDMECAIKIIKEKYPDYAEDADRYMNGRVFYPYNIFIMKKGMFFEYCDFLFNVLFETEKRIDTSHYSKRNLRVFSEIGERLLGIFVEHKKRLENIPVGIKQRFCFGDVVEYKSPISHFNHNCIPIIFISDDNNAIRIAVAINSIIQSSVPENNYDFYILYDELDDINKKLIVDTSDNLANVHIELVNVSTFLKEYDPVPNFNVPVEMFLLIVPELFSEFDKVLYFDSDILCFRDVADLFKIDFGDRLLACVIDPVFISQYNGLNPTIKDYADNVLRLSNPYGYFSTGVLALNLKVMRSKLQKYEAIKEGCGKTYKNTSRDVLNIKCEGKVRYLDMAWNVVPKSTETKVIEIYALQEITDSYNKSKNDPNIINFAYGYKPWNNPGGEFAEEFWKSLRNTSLYEKMIFYPPKN